MAEPRSLTIQHVEEGTILAGKTYGEFLIRVIDDGIAGARKDYHRPDQAHKLEGALAGFEACRGKTPGQISMLLDDARKRVRQKLIDNAQEKTGDPKDYWRIRCEEAEIEWVANVVSAILAANGLPVIITPTAGGTLKAANVMGQYPYPDRDG